MSPHHALLYNRKIFTSLKYIREMQFLPIKFIFAMFEKKFHVINLVFNLRN